jgi:opacity protein-like surface antigen
MPERKTVEAGLFRASRERCRRIDEVRPMGRLWLVASVMVMTSAAAAAQDERRGFVGVLAGVSTLSADGRAVISAPDAATSLYKPENGIALDVFAGVHIGRFVAVQGNYMWNRNDLTLVSSFVTPQGGGFYEQQRRSAQHAVVGDALLYFRRLGSGVRPYLGTGICLVRFSSGDAVRSRSSNLAAPAGEINATKIALRSHVGIDLALSPRVSFRYSFSETISGNPISPRLMPPGKRGLANFQNLFGLIVRF